MCQSRIAGFRPLFVCMVVGVWGSMVWVYPASGQTLIEIGQERGRVSVPISVVAEHFPDIVPQVRLLERNLVAPSRYPISDLLVELPDVVNVLTGYHDSDIPHLVADNLIEPLDDLLEAMGVTAADFIPGALDAVRYEGHVWAIPYTAQGFVLSYNRAFMTRAGIPSDFASWEETLGAAVSISKALTSSPGFAYGGLWGGRVSPQCSLALFLWCSGESSLSAPGVADACRLIQAAHAQHAFAIREPEHNNLIHIETFATARPDEIRRLAPFPLRVRPGGPCRRMPLFLESFALRKSTPEKLAAGKKFLQWLLTSSAHVSILRATLQTAARDDVASGFHVPVLLKALSAPEYMAVANRVTDYEVLLEACNQGSISPPTPEEEALRRTVIAPSFEVAFKSFSSGNFLSAFNALKNVNEGIELSVPSRVSEDPFSKY